MIVRPANSCEKFPTDLAKLRNNVTQNSAVAWRKEGYTGGMLIALSQATRTEIARIGVTAGFFEIGGPDMIPETIRNPHSNLPFELFRSFGPMFDKHPPFTAWTPPCDIYETDKEIVLKMELPEMRKENVQVTLEKNVLKLRGERKFAEKANRENYHRIERTYGEFVRIFTLPTSVEGSTALTEFKEGMLTVTLSKNEAAIFRQIEVKVM